MDDQSDGQFGQFSGPGKFFAAFWGCGVSTSQNFKMLGSVMNFIENVNSAVGRFVCLVKKKLGSTLGGGGLGWSTFQKYVIYYENFFNLWVAFVLVFWG